MGTWKINPRERHHERIVVGSIFECGLEHCHRRISKLMTEDKEMRLPVEIKMEISNKDKR
jgi:hypothetical protein